MPATLPDVLVLGGGGVLGEAWMMGVLSGIEDDSKLDLRRCEYFVGTSAGSIVAARLAAGRRPRRPDRLPARHRRADAPAAPAGGLAEASAQAARRAGAFALAMAGAFAPLALGLAAPGGAIVRAAALRRLPRPEERLEDLRANIESLGARFDGRLRVVAVERSSGRRVIFGSPGAPRTTVARAVAASCSVPWLFAPVRIGEREYVDGGVWSPTNLDAAPAGRGSLVLCLNPTASLIGAGDLISTLRSVSRSAAAVEALALRARGAEVRVFGPDEASAQAIGENLMDRSRTPQVLNAAYRQGLTIAGAWS
jgi:NTE family protein